MPKDTGALEAVRWGITVRLPSGPLGGRRHCRPHLPVAGCAAR